MYAASAISLASESVLTDKAKLRKLRDSVNRFAPTSKQRVGLKVEELDLPGWFTKVEHSVNERKEGYEEDLKERMLEVIDHDTPPLQANTSI